MPLKTQPLSLKRQGEAIEQASKFYDQGNFIRCAQSLLGLCSDPKIASIDILTRIILCNTNCSEQEVQNITQRKIVALKTEVSYQEHLMLVLIKEIAECPREKFISFLAEEKSANAVEQLKEARGDAVYGQMLASFHLGSHAEEVSALGEVHEGKEEGDE